MRVKTVQQCTGRQNVEGAEKNRRVPGGPDISSSGIRGQAGWCFLAKHGTGVGNTRRKRAAVVFTHGGGRNGGIPKIVH